MTESFDCVRCGACCVWKNDPTVQVDIRKEDLALLTQEEIDKFVVQGKDMGFTGGMGLLLFLRVKKTDYGWSCIAFEGSPGGPCGCSIYDRRPKVCRDFEPGPKNRTCLKCRKEFSIEGE